MSAELPDPRKQLAYEESIRALTLQSDTLDDPRGRTGILLTAASLTATFIGARALDGGFDVWTKAAVGLFLIAGGFCLRVLWPSGDWNFTFNAKKILDDYVNASAPATLDEMHSEFAEVNQVNWEKNAESLRWLHWSFRLAILALVLQVLCWLIAIGNAHG